MTAARRQVAPLKVTTTGSPAAADLRGLAAILLKLDQAPPVRLVSKTSPAGTKLATSCTKDPS